MDKKEAYTYLRKGLYGLASMWNEWDIDLLSIIAYEVTKGDPKVHIGKNFTRGSGEEAFFIYRKYVEPLCLIEYGGCAVQFADEQESPSRIFVYMPRDTKVVRLSELEAVEQTIGDILYL